MPIPITVPRLGWTMDEGVFGGWLKRDGELVEVGDPLFSLESEKATQEVEAIDRGILRISPAAPKSGDVVLVGSVVGYLAEPGEEITWEPAGVSGGPPAHREPEAGSVRSGEIERADEVPDPGGGGAVAAISPRALRLAGQLGVDWTAVRATGRSGRIRERDVREYYEKHGRTPGAPVARPAASGRVIPLSSLRKSIAARLSAAATTTVPVTVVTEIDATNLIRLRDEFQRTGSDRQHRPAIDSLAGPQEFAPPHVVPTYTDFIVKFAAAALQHHPSLMAQWTDDGLFIPNAIDINLAVETEAGLVAPLIRDVPRLNIQQIATMTRSVIEMAHARRLAMQQLEPGAFTISNLGMYGIDAFTPVLNMPQSAILGVGRIRRMPVVWQDQIVPRDRITLSLTFDHRVIDGVPAAKFLDTLRELIENPASVDGVY